jgi:hypothetical protein
MDAMEVFSLFNAFCCILSCPIRDLPVFSNETRVFMAPSRVVFFFLSFLTAMQTREYLSNLDDPYQIQFFFC